MERREPVEWDDEYGREEPKNIVDLSSPGAEARYGYFSAGAHQWVMCDPLPGETLDQYYARMGQQGDDMTYNPKTGIVNYEGIPSSTADLGQYQVRSPIPPPRQRLSRGGFVYNDEAESLVNWLQTYLNGSASAVMPIMDAAQEVAISQDRTVVRPTDVITVLERLVTNVHDLLTQRELDNLEKELTPKTEG